MAADGAGEKLTPAPPPDGGDAGARRALSDLQSLLGQMEGWLTTLEATPLDAAAAAELTASVEALGRKVGSADPLSEKLAALAKRLQAQLGESRQVAEEMAAVVPAATAPPRRRRVPLRPWLVGGAAAAALVAAGVWLSRTAEPPSAAPPPPPMVAVTPARPAPSESAASGASQRLAAGPTTGAPAPGLDRLRMAAEAGRARDQLLYAQALEAGAAGRAPDLAAARIWTRRAAEGGDPVAQHNLALFLLSGEAGRADPAEAAGWFRKAAARGVADSQHNLGLLYERGLGVGRDRQEALRWFNAAANGGDLRAREKAVALEAALAAEANAVPLIPPATTLAATQALLARGGYYVGPMDGNASPALKAAALAYLRDHPDVLGGG